VDLLRKFEATEDELAAVQEKVEEDLGKKEAAIETLMAVEEELVSLQIVNKKQLKLLKKEQKVLAKGGFPLTPLHPYVKDKFCHFYTEVKAAKAEVTELKRAAAASMEDFRQFMKLCKSQLLLAVDC